MLISSGFGNALFIAGLTILVSLFAAGFLPVFLISLAIIYFKRKQEGPKSPAFLSYFWALVFGFIGGIVGIWGGYRIDNYYARRSYRYNQEFSKEMQQQYKIDSADFSETRDKIILKIVVPRDDVYNVRVRSGPVGDYGNVVLPFTKDFWRSNLKKGENELIDEISDGYLTQENLNLIVSIYPSTEGEGASYVRRDLNNLFKAKKVTLIEGVQYYSPDIPFSLACSGIPGLPCITESKLKVNQE